MKKKFAIVLALFLIAVVCSAGCIDPQEPVDPVVPVDPIDPITPVDPVDPEVPAEEYSIMFMLNYDDAGAYSAETVKAGETVSKPANPTRSGYTFKGWFTAAEGGAEYDFTQAVNADVTLYAQWKKKSSGSSHSHSYTGEVTTEPTCGVAGVKTYTCGCGASYTEAIPATGEHVLSLIVKDGKNVFDCDKCDYFEEGGSASAVTYVAQVGNDFYAVFAEAVANATTKGKNLVLLIDTTESIDRAVIIDTNGKIAKLTYSDVKHIKILKSTATDKDNVTLIDNSISKKIAFGTGVDGDDCLVVKSASGASTLDIYTLEGLKDFRDVVNGGEDFSGMTVTLMDNIDLSSVENWVPIGSFTVNGDSLSNAKPFKGIFDGNDCKISNMKVAITSGVSSSAGFFGFLAGTVKDLTIEDVVITSSHYAGAVAGYAHTSYASGSVFIENCKVNGGTITSAPHNVGGNYDDGDKVGGIVGHAKTAVLVTGCAVEDVTIQAYRDIGGIAGYCDGGSITGNTVSGVTLIQDLTNGYKSPVPTTIKAIIGREEGTITLTPANTATNVEIYTVVDSTAELRTAMAVDGITIKLAKDITDDGDNTITIPKGKELTLDLNGKTLAAETDVTTTGNRELFLVKGTLNIQDGTVTCKHVGDNMAWNSMTTIFDITDGGVLNMEGVTAKNLGGSDMNFVVHMNNWGEVTLNADDCTLSATYIAVRVFNSGYDENNVKITNSALSGKYALWVHNYTPEDFGNDQTKVDAAKKRLNFEIFDKGNTFTTTGKAPIIYGFTNAVYYDASGNVVE